MVWQLIVAMIGAVLASQILGFLWYGPLFGKVWIKGMGWEKLSKKKMEEMQKAAIPGYLLGAGFAAAATGLLWMVMVTWDGFSVTSDISNVAAGILVAAVGWAAFYAPGQITSAFFQETKWSFTFVSAGYFFVLALAEGALVGALSGL